MTDHTAIDLNDLNNALTHIINHIPQYANVLEIGCNDGKTTAALKEIHQARVIGIEQDPQAAKQASTYCDYVFTENPDDQHALDALQFEKFDAITLSDQLTRLKDPLSLLKRIKPLLLDEGQLLISIPNAGHALMRLKQLCAGLTNKQADYNKVQAFYAWESVQTLLNDAGYQVTDVTFTWDDMPDNEIQAHLDRIGLTLTQEASEFFHSNDCTIKEFIITATPALFDGKTTEESTSLQRGTPPTSHASSPLPEQNNNKLNPAC